MAPPRVPERSRRRRSASTLAIAVTCAAGFGIAPAVAAPAADAVELRGVVLAGAHGAHAILAMTDGTQRTYAVGDRIPAGATLVAVAADRVTLQREGREEVFRLGATRLAEAAPAESAPEAAPAAAEPAEARREADAGYVDDRRDNPRASAFLADLRRSLLADPDAVAQMVAVEPLENDGKFSGFRLHSDTHAALLARAGLQPGDVLTAVNGVAFDGPDSAMLLLPRELVKASELEIDLLRNGAPVRVKLRVGQ